jgi:cytochrome P450
VTDDTADLPTGINLTPLNAGFRERPHEILDRLRAREPVHRDRQFDRVFLTRFADIDRVLNDRRLAVDPRKSRAGSYARLVHGVDEKFRPTMLHMDDPDHRRLRRLVAQAFNPRAIEALRPR